jgi:hypothetical protein
MATFLQCGIRLTQPRQVESRVTLVALGLDNEGICGHVEADLAVGWAMCLIGQMDQLFVFVLEMCLLLVRNRSSLPVGNWPLVGALERVSDCVVVPTFQSLRC